MKACWNTYTKHVTGDRTWILEAAGDNSAATAKRDSGVDVVDSLRRLREDRRCSPRRSCCTRIGLYRMVSCSDGGRDAGDRALTARLSSGEEVRHHVVLISGDLLVENERLVVGPGR